MTQFDIIQQQAEAAARNAVAGAAGRLRRDTSIVNQASALAGRAVREGKTAWEKRNASSSRCRRSCSATVEEPSPSRRSSRDGYVRRSPVQPVHRAVDYRRRQVVRAMQVIAVVAVVCVGVSLLGRLGVFGR